jgi:outer membrane protein assembly factor BamB
MANLISSAMAVMAVMSVAANDWPQWLGPNRDGVSAEKDLLTSWPEGGPALAWKVTNLGGGYSGVAVSKGCIYTMGENAQESFILAMKESDGTLLWSAKAGKAGAPGWGGFAGPRATPTVDGDRIYALSHYGELVCVETASGKEIWRKHLVDDLGGKLPEWGFSESPLVDGDRVICTPGGAQGALAALNKTTGAVLWRSKDFQNPAQYESVIIATIEGTKQYVQLTDTAVAGVDPETGKVLWRGTHPGEVAVIPTPIWTGNYIFITSGYEAGSGLFKISRNGSSWQADKVYEQRAKAVEKDGKVEKTRDPEALDNHHGGVVLIDGYLYGHGDTPGWVCKELQTGKLVWKETKKQRKGSIVAFGNYLITRAEEGEGTVVLVEASPKGFVEKGRFDQPDRSGKNSWPHPVIANGKLYLRDQNVLLCYDIKSGR